MEPRELGSGALKAFSGGGGGGWSLCLKTLGNVGHALSCYDNLAFALHARKTTEKLI
jgi:hypothetical protein